MRWVVDGFNLNRKTNFRPGWGESKPLLPPPSSLLRPPSSVLPLPSSLLPPRSVALVVDESMIPWKGNTGAAGLVPHLSYVKRKPEPLGVELKTVCDCSTGDFSPNPNL